MAKPLEALQRVFDKDKWIEIDIIIISPKIAEIIDEEGN